MNIIDALKTGKKIRVAGSNNVFCDPKAHTFSYGMLMKEWEVEPETSVSSYAVTVNRFDDRSEYRANITSKNKSVEKIDLLLDGDGWNPKLKDSDVMRLENDGNGLRIVSKKVDFHMDYLDAERVLSLLLLEQHVTSKFRGVAVRILLDSREEQDFKVFNSGEEKDDRCY